MSDVESAVLGLDHGEIGAHLAQRWGLPEALRDAIGYHHDPQSAPTHKQLAALIGLADVLARDLKVGTGGGATPKLSDEHMEIAGISRDDQDAILEDLSGEIDESIEQMRAL